MAVSLSLRLFGEFETLVDGRPPADLRLREGHRLLAFLALSHQSSVSYQTLARIFWPSEVRAAGQDLSLYRNTRQALFSLRRALGPEGWRVASSGKGQVALNLAGADADFVAFDTLTTAGDYSSLARAIELYRDPLLSNWADPWTQEPRLRRARSFDRAVRRALTHVHATGDDEAAIAHLRAALIHIPDNEDLRRDLIGSLARMGRPDDAETAYEEACRWCEAAGRAIDPQTDELIAVIRAEVRIHGARPAQARAQSPVVERPAVSVVEKLEVGPPSTLEPIGGAIPPGSPFYIERPADSEFGSALARQDMIVLVTGARQMGKTSLVSRGLQACRSDGVKVVLTDLQMLNESQLASPDALLFSLATALALQLDIDGPDSRTWNPDAGPNMNLETFLRRRVLAMLDGPVVWALDEVDRLFTVPYSSDVFGLFRSWYNRRGLDPSGPWSRLTLVLTYATEARLFIRDLNQSPFNVGTRVALDDFSEAEVRELNRRYGSPLRNDDEVHQFQDLVGGQPYLTRCGLDAMVRYEFGIERLILDADSDSGPFGEHLRRIVHALTRDPEMAGVARGMLAGVTPDHDSFFRLRSAGLAAGAGPSSGRIRCRLYEQYLRERL